ncbi:MAG: hypothetical protein K2X44_08810 [Magnetospirillum sp.]|nr:hypothetical protein [Magnetospirillum sp.]
MKPNALRTLAFMAAAIVTSGAALAETPPSTLAQYAVKPGITLSGVSSGAAMALQYAVAWSDEVSGIGAIAGVPYGCAEGTLSFALNRCMAASWPGWFGARTDDPPDPKHLFELMRRQEEKGAIGSLAAQTRQKVWWFSSSKDKVVVEASAKVTESLYQQVYEHAGAAHWQDGFKANIRPDHLERETPSPAESYARTHAVHAQITPEATEACDHAGMPFLVNCRAGDTSFDASGEMFSHFYGALKAKTGDGTGGSLKVFEQKPFIDAVVHDGNHTPPSSQGMRFSFAKTGHVFVPERCETQACRLHVALHGCAMGDSDAYALKAGYNNWAAANDIIVLYPRVVATTATFQAINPQGCWDWWGYAGGDYATRNGAQMQVLHNMVNAFRRESER